MQNKLLFVLHIAAHRHLNYCQANDSSWSQSPHFDQACGDALHFKNNKLKVSNDQQLVKSEPNPCLRNLNGKQPKLHKEITENIWLIEWTVLSPKVATQLDMSLVVRKPVFRVSDLVRRKPSSAATGDG